MLQIDVRDGTDTTGAIKNYTDQVLEHRMVDLTNAPAARRRLEQRVAQAILQSQKDLIDEVNGRPNVSVNDAFFDKARGQPREAPKVVRKQSTPMDAPWLLDRASEEFLKEIRVRRRDKGYFAVRTTMRLMRSFFGSKADVRKLRRADCRSFREFVMSLPTNYTKGYRGIEPKDIPAIRRSEHDLMSYGNVNKTLDHVSLFMNWLEAEEIVEQVPQLRSLKLKDPVSEKEKRKPFQADHLKLIFGSDRMRAERESQSMFFWCSVVGLYHGLRLDEIVSLDASCVTEIDGHPIIQVKLPNEVRDQTIRGGTKTVPRYLPMHPILVGLGLPEFARSRPLGEMLFAEARRNADGYFSDDMSEDFRTFVHELGVPKGGPTFHSLRHNFRDAMSNADLSDQVAAYLGGWKLRGVMNTTYGSHDLRPIHREGIEKVG
jgi:integrase